MESRRYSAKNRRGHVDVTIIGPSGTILKKIGTLHYPRNRPRKRRGGSSFKVHIPFVPPTGSTIRVEYHETFDIPPEERLRKEEKNSPDPKTRPIKESYSKFAVRLSLPEETMFI